MESELSDKNKNRVGVFSLKTFSTAALSNGTTAAEAKAIAMRSMIYFDIVNIIVEINDVVRRVCYHRFDC